MDMFDDLIININIGGEKYHKKKLDVHYKVARPENKEKEDKMFECTCTNEEKVKITVAATTGGGKSVTPVNLKVDVVSGDGTAEVVDASSFYLISGNAIDVTNYAVSADFDPAGSGKLTSFTDTIALDVTEPVVKSMGFVAGAPELK
jgi:hypothetical protein